MTTPAKADKSSITSVLRSLVGPVLRDRVGKSKSSSKVAVSVVQEAATDIAVNALAQHIKDQVPPEVALQVDAYQTQLGIYRTYLSGLVRQCTEIIKCADGIGTHEFIQKTGHGSAAISTARKLEGHLEDVHGALNDLLAMESKLPLVQSTAGLAPYKAFDVRVQDLITKAKPLAEETGESFTEAIEFEAIKAIVVADPKNAHLKIKGVFWVVDQGLNFMKFSGGLFGVIPSPFTTPVAAGLNNASRVLSILSALAKRELISQENTAKVEQYRNTHAKDDTWAEHAKNPAAMAEMLAKKREADIDIALLCADAVVGPLTDLATPAGFVWDAVRQSIDSLCKAHIARRLELLKEQLGQQAADATTVAAVAKEFGAALVDEFAKDITNLLNPLNALKGAVLSMAGDRIAKMIMAHIPVDPAEPIDGGTLKGEADQMAAAMIDGMPKRDDAFAARMAAAEAAAAPPTKDKDGNAVEMLLSDVLTDDQKKTYRLARIGGRTGALYLEGLEFRADQVDATSKTILDALPATDAKGRKVDEADLDVGFALDHPAPPAMKVTGNHMWVRIGALWGYIDTTSRVFWPATVDRSGFTTWENRRIAPEGYYENGTLVEGKWYQPFPEHHSAYYLFVGDSGHQWARAGDNTGSGKGNKHTIVNLVKTAGSFDVSRL
jgi:hypothetical protein